MPTRSELVGNILDDLPIGLTTVERLQYLIKPLDAPLGTGEGSFLLQARCSGQHNIGVPAGIAEEDILHDKELELGQAIVNEV